MFLNRHVHLHNIHYIWLPTRSSRSRCYLSSLLPALPARESGWAVVGYLGPSQVYGDGEAQMCSHWNFSPLSPIRNWFSACMRQKLAIFSTLAFIQGQFLSWESKSDDCRAEQKVSLRQIAQECLQRDGCFICVSSVINNTNFILIPKRPPYFLLPIGMELRQTLETMQTSVMFTAETAEVSLCPSGKRIPDLVFGKPPRTSHEDSWALGRRRKAGISKGDQAWRRGQLRSYDNQMSCKLGLEVNQSRHAFPAEWGALAHTWTSALPPELHRHLYVNKPYGC